MCRGRGSVGGSRSDSHLASHLATLCVSPTCLTRKDPFNIMLGTDWSTTELRYGLNLNVFYIVKSLTFHRCANL